MAFQAQICENDFTVKSPLVSNTNGNAITFPSYGNVIDKIIYVNPQFHLLDMKFKELEDNMSLFCKNYIGKSNV